MHLHSHTHRTRIQLLTPIVAVIISIKLQQERKYLVLTDTIDVYMILGCGILDLDCCTLFEPTDALEPHPPPPSSIDVISRSQR